MKNKTIWQGPQDFMKPTGQHVNLLFNLRPECPHHLQLWVFSLLSQQATSLWGHGQFPHVTVQVRTAQHSSFTKLRPWLGSYEGCSFICSSLIPRSLSSAREPCEDQTKEHTQRHDDVGYVGDDQGSVNHRLQSTCSLFINENTLIDVHHWENHGSDVSRFTTKTKDEIIS